MILLKIISFFALLYGIAGLISRLFKIDIKDNFGRVVEKKSINLPIYKPLGIIGLFTFILLSLIIKIGAQDVGVVVKPTGVDPDELNTGWHIIMPWNKVHKMDKTVWVYTCAQSTKEGQKSIDGAIWAPTKDGIKMGFDASVSWRIIPSEASWIYANVSEDQGIENARYEWLEENVIRAKLKSALALVVSEYTPIEAYSNKRQDIQDKVIAKMRRDVFGYKLQIDQVDLREVFYNPEFEKAINSKKLAEQEVLRLVEVTRQKQEQLLQAEIDKNMKIQQAQGEAEALKIKGNAIAQNPKIVTLEWISAWKEGGSQVPKFISGSGNSPFLMNISVE